MHGRIHTMTTIYDELVKNECSLALPKAAYITLVCRLAKDERD